MKKYLLCILSVFLFLLCSGCGKANFQLTEDQYYLCSTPDVTETGTVLLDNQGEIVKSFPNLYVYILIDTDGHILNQYAGTISKDMILIMCSIKEFKEHSLPYYGVYRVGESDWILEPRKSKISYTTTWNSSRFSELQIDDVVFNNEFEIVDEYIEDSPMYYGQNGYHTKINETSDNVIVDQNENLILDADTFYNKNKSIVPYFPSNTELSLYDLINEECMIVEYSHYFTGETLTGTFKQSDFTYLYFCTPDGTILGTDLDYSEDYTIQRQRYNSYNLNFCASKNFLRGTNDNITYEHLKVEGKKITKLHLPDMAHISFLENGFYLIDDGNNYTVYDGEEDKKTLSFTSDLRLPDISILGQNSYRIYGNPETDKNIELHLVLSGNEIPTYEQDYIGLDSTIQVAGQYSIIHPLNSDGKSHSSYITDRSGKCILKTAKNVIWIDENYMLAFKDKIYYIYDRNENLIKKVSADS